MNKQEITEKVNEAIQSEFISPYRLGKIESVLRGKIVPPQKIYGYIRQGYIASELNELGKMTIARKEAVRYLVKTLEKNS